MSTNEKRPDGRDVQADGNEKKVITKEDLTGINNRLPVKIEPRRTEAKDVFKKNMETESTRCTRMNQHLKTNREPRQVRELFNHFFDDEKRAIFVKLLFFYFPN